MSETIKEQLEALGFKSIEPAQQSGKGHQHGRVPAVPNRKPKKAKLGIRYKQMPLDEAKSIVKRLYRDPKNWCLPEFAKAFRAITGSGKILHPTEAKRIVAINHNLDSRKSNWDYSVAVLLLSGVWIKPDRKLDPNRMSNQVKARTERRDLNASYVAKRIF